jgi:predicted aldo/keto reductase-like oxidoreductase
MQYRKFGRVGHDVSILGFGAMRLPSDKEGNVDEEDAIVILRYAIDCGVNYVDTAYVYHDGKSEVIVGEALKDGYREKVMVATKSPVWFMKASEDFDRILAEQLKRLDTDYIDCYMFHGIGSKEWRTMLELKLVEKAEAAKKNGFIRHLGFSFHDNLETFASIVDGYDKWEFCQIQYNYMDVEKQAGTAGLEYAASKGLGIIIMEPLLGGRLSNPPRAIKKLFAESGYARSASEWALRWIWNRPEVSIVLSGMSSMDQVEENIGTAEISGANTLSEKELRIIGLARDKYGERAAIPCTECGYCKPCPNGVDIPRNFSLYNDAVMYDDPNDARFAYDRFFDHSEHADHCTQCRECEERCPQKIPIGEWMPRVSGALGEGKPF